MALAYPWMRDELIDHLHALADHHQQLATWDEDAGVLNYIVHFLFDDTPLPKNAINYYLETDDEVAAVVQVVNAIDNVFCHYGMNLSDQEYIKKPEWEDVMRAARAALQTLIHFKGGDSSSSSVRRG